MRIAFAPLMIVLGATVACNAIVGYHDLEKTPTGQKSGSSGDDDDDNGDDDDTTSSSGQSSGKPGTSSSGSSGTGDAGAGGGCDLTKDFANPVSLAGPIATSDFNGNATLTTDELTIVFQRSTDADNGQILRATRNAIDQDFGAPAPISELAQINKDFEPGLRADGLFLFWAEADGTGRKQIMVASRTAANAPFENPQPFSFTQSNKYDSQPYVTADGSELYFASDRGSNVLRIYRTKANATGWDTPAEVTELRSNGGEFHVTLSHDGLTMYFASDRTPNVGDIDVYAATRANKTVPFSDIRPIAGLNTSSAEVPTYVSADNCRLYITRLVGAGAQIMVAQRPRL